MNEVFTKVWGRQGAPVGSAAHSGCQPWEPSPLQARRESGREESRNPERDAWRETVPGREQGDRDPAFTLLLGIHLLLGLLMLEPTGSRGRGALRFTPWLVLQDGFGGAAKEAHVTCPQTSFGQLAWLGGGTGCTTLSQQEPLLTSPPHPLFTFICLKTIRTNLSLIPWFHQTPQEAQTLITPSSQDPHLHKTSETTRQSPDPGLFNF